jgi:hypothetical protein
MTKLYQLTEQYKGIEGMLDREIEYISQDEINQTLASIKVDIEEKVVNIAKLVLELKSDAEGIKAEEERLAKRRSGCVSKIEWLKNYLLIEMLSVNVLKVKRDVVSVSVQNNPPSAELISIEQVPEQFIRVIPERKEPDKKAIIEHFKETGEIVPGINIVLDKKFVSIR